MGLNKLLVVDDNASFRQIVIAMLGDTAKEYVECPSGSEALDCYQQHQPDFVVMDFEMQGMDGIAATRGILKDFPEAKILLCSQHDDADLESQADQAGACGFLAKDDLRALSRFIEQYFHENDLPSPLHASSSAKKAESNRIPS